MLNEVTASRRELLQASAAGGVAWWLVHGPAGAWAQATKGGDDGGDYLRRSSWLPRLGETLAIGGAEVRLEAVSDIGHAAERGLAGSDDAFVLLFSGADPVAFDQGIHSFALADGPSGTLFVVPIDRPGSRQLYEVLVDRSVGRGVRSEPSARTQPGDTAPGAIGGAGAAPSEAATPGAAAPDPRYAFLRFLRMARGRPGLRARLRVAAGARLDSVSLRVSRNGVTYARGSGPIRRGAADVGLRLHRPLPRGAYEVAVTATDATGRKTTVRRTLRIS